VLLPGNNCDCSKIGKPVVWEKAKGFCGLSEPPSSE
jgi:hypothetical protein